MSEKKELYEAVHVCLSVPFILGVIKPYTPRPFLVYLDATRISGHITTTLNTTILFLFLC